MFYLIFGILILLFYIFAAPQSIKGTLNVVVLVIALVAFIILLGLAVFQLPSEFFVGIAMIGVAYFSLRDISKLSQKDRKVSFRSKLRNRQE